MSIDVAIMFFPPKTATAASPVPILVSRANHACRRTPGGEKLLSIRSSVLNSRGWHGAGRALEAGKSPEVVLPVTVMGPSSCNLNPVMESVLDPPRKVEYSSRFPSAERRDT